MNSVTSLRWRYRSENNNWDSYCYNICWVGQNIPKWERAETSHLLPANSDRTRITLYLAILVAIAEEGAELAGVGMIVNLKQIPLVEFECARPLTHHLPDNIEKLRKHWR